MIAEVCPFINTPLISEKYKGYNLTVRGSTSAGLGDPAEQNNVFTSEESKWNGVYRNFVLSIISSMIYKVLTL